MGGGWPLDGHQYVAGTGNLLKRRQGRSAQRDSAQGGVVRLVVVDLQAQRLEQPAGEFVRQRVEVAGADRQQVEQVGVWLVVGLFFEGFQFGGQVGAFGQDFGAAVLDVLDESVVGFVLVPTADFEGSGQAYASCVEIDDGPLDRRNALSPRPFSLRVQVAQCGSEQVVAVLAEDVVAEEVIEAVEECGFAHPEAVRVPVGDVARLGCAGVVGGFVAGLAEHAAAAEFAEQVGAQPVGAFGGRVRVGSGVGAGSFAAADDLLGGDEGVQVDDLVVGGVAGPHPFLDRVGTAVAGFHRAPVPHHVAGVLGLGQDLADTAPGPATDRSLRIHGGGWRIGDQIGVQPDRDRFIAEPLGDPPFVDRADNRGFGGIRDEEGLRSWSGAALAPMTRSRLATGLGSNIHRRGGDACVVLVEPRLESGARSGWVSTRLADGRPFRLHVGRSDRVRNFRPRTRI